MHYPAIIATRERVPFQDVLSNPQKLSSFNDEVSFCRRDSCIFFDVIVDHCIYHIASPKIPLGNLYMAYTGPTEFQPKLFVKNSVIT